MHGPEALECSGQKWNQAQVCVCAKEKEKRGGLRLEPTTSPLKTETASHCPSIAFVLQRGSAALVWLGKEQ